MFIGKVVDSPGLAGAWETVPYIDLDGFVVALVGNTANNDGRPPGHPHRQGFHPTEEVRHAQHFTEQDAGLLGRSPPPALSSSPNRARFWSLDLSAVAAAWVRGC